MVARVDREMFANALHTSDPDLFDSDEVLLAVETARDLEAEGELLRAAKWLRRATRAAEIK